MKGGARGSLGGLLKSTGMFFVYDKQYKSDRWGWAKCVFAKKTNQSRDV